MLSILAFLFGASVGSFVQVVVSRLHVAPFMKSRSKCLSCGEVLRVSDLVPVLSYLFLKGKCRYCKTRYGISAVVIEVIFGLVFTCVYLFLIRGQYTLPVAIVMLAYYSVLIAVLGVMALYDRLHSYVPVNFLLAFFILSLVSFVYRLVEYPNMLTLVGALSVSLPFLFIWFISKGKGVGFGDVLLFFCVGLYFGGLEGYAVFILSVWIGAVYGIYYKYFVQKHSSLHTSIPFVPFIVIAFLLVLFTGIDIFSIASVLS